MIPQFMAKIATKTIWDLGVHNTQGTAEDSQKAHQKYQNGPKKRVVKKQRQDIPDPNQGCISWLNLNVNVTSSVHIFQP